MGLFASRDAEELGNPLVADGDAEVCDILSAYSEMCD